jgi:hypothetical protein
MMTVAAIHLYSTETIILRIHKGAKTTKGEEGVARRLGETHLMKQTDSIRQGMHRGMPDASRDNLHNRLEMSASIAPYTTPQGTIPQTASRSYAWPEKKTIVEIKGNQIVKTCLNHHYLSRHPPEHQTAT